MCAVLCKAHRRTYAPAHEGYGLGLVEAALAGLPIVTTNVGIAGDVLSPGVGALIAPVGVPERLAEEMLRMIENKPLAELLSRQARTAAEMHIAAFKNQPALVAADIARLAGNDSMSRL